MLSEADEIKIIGTWDTALILLHSGIRYKKAAIYPEAPGGGNTRQNPKIHSENPLRNGLSFPRMPDVPLLYWLLSYRLLQ